MDFLSTLVQQIITVIYSLLTSMGIPNYGLAIIIMTVLVKLLLSPLTAKQIKSTKAMATLQPKMKELQARYKDDKALLNQKMAELYKQSGVNPLSGCLPLLVQMPIMIGIYYGIRDFNYVGPTDFLWVTNLSTSAADISLDNPLAYAIGLILPVLSAVTTFIQSKQTMPDSSQAQAKVTLYMMPLFMGWMSWKFPAGLVLYWVVMNTMQIGQQFIMERIEATKN